MSTPDYDLVGPWRGPCGLCGGPDARHRLYEAIAERVLAGESAGEVAATYDETTEWTQAIVDDYRFTRPDDARRISDRFESEDG